MVEPVATTTIGLASASPTLSLIINALPSAPAGRVIVVEPL
jgi:hypothetical protein